MYSFRINTLHLKSRPNIIFLNTLHEKEGEGAVRICNRSSPTQKPPGSLFATFLLQLERTLCEQNSPGPMGHGCNLLKRLGSLNYGKGNLERSDPGRER